MAGTVEGDQLQSEDARYDVAESQGWSLASLVKPLSRATAQGKRTPRQIVLKQVSNEVHNRLKKSLHRISLERWFYMEPDAKEDPNQVEDPWECEVKVGEQPVDELKRVRVSAIYDRSGIDGRLLILGAPGTGKTTALLKLAEELVVRAKKEEQAPVPVVLNLSSWKKDTQDIEQWLVRELKVKYGVRSDIGQRWIRGGEIIPLLDGLDELAAVRQEPCIKRINQFLQPGIWPEALVVCSRTKDYQLYATKLGLNGSLILKPWSVQTVREYALQVADGPQLWQSIEGDPLLLQEDSDDPDSIGLARIPLLLNILALAYQTISFSQWQQLQSPEERRHYLFDAYIRRMLERPYKCKKKPYTDEEVWRWLNWLARKLIEQDETEFFIERLQPNWLPSRSQRRIYRLVSGLIGGLSVGLIFGLISGLSDELIVRLSDELMGRLVSGLSVGLSVELMVGLVSGLSSGLIFGLMVGVSGRLRVRLGHSEIKTIETLQFSLEEAKNGLIVGLSVGLSVGLVSGLVSGLSVGLSVGLIAGLQGPEIEIKDVPNQGIWQSLRNIITFTTLSFPFCIALGVLPRLATSQSVSISKVLIFGLGMAVIFGIMGSGIPVIQHFSLRLVLWGNGFIPWNYARFLNYCTDRLFLQRVGGGYRFIHDLLRRHIAQSYSSSRRAEEPK